MVERPPQRHAGKKFRLQVIKTCTRKFRASVGFFLSPLNRSEANVETGPLDKGQKSTHCACRRLRQIQIESLSAQGRYLATARRGWQGITNQRRQCPPGSWTSIFHLFSYLSSRSDLLASTYLSALRSPSRHIFLAAMATPGVRKNPDDDRSCGRKAEG